MAACAASARGLSTSHKKPQQVVIAGGGVIGCATAYFLAKEHGIGATIVDRKTAATNTQTAALVRSYARENCRVLASEPMMKGWDIEVVVHGDCKAPAPQ